MSLVRQHPIRIALAVLLGLALGLGIDVARTGGPRLWLARHGLPPPYLPAGRTIDLDGGTFYLDCRGEGSPTVVLESGAGSGAGAWSPVFDDLTALTRTCAYDRAGLGSSDPRGVRTLALAAGDLRRLLEAAGERPPWVVVGHSLGGTYARLFASEHRDETAGIVLLDSFDPDLEVDAVHPLLGDLRASYEQRLDRLRDTVAQWESMDWPTSEAQLRASSIDGLRLVVLVAPRGDPRLDSATNRQIRAARQASYERLSPGRVTYRLAHGSGHLIPIDRPDLVVAAIREVVIEARAADR